MRKTERATKLAQLREEIAKEKAWIKTPDKGELGINEENEAN